MALPTRLRRVFDSDRLRSLDTYRVAGTGREAVFDRIAGEAAAACRTPMSFVTLLDDRRQWIKGSFGASAAETLLDRAICAAAIEADGLFVVPDCAADPRVNWSPAVFGVPPVAFYAGAPLLDPNGLPLGALCVVDTVPRHAGLTVAEGIALGSLSEEAMTILNGRRAESTGV